MNNNNNNDSIIARVKSAVSPTTVAANRNARKQRRIVTHQPDPGLTPDTQRKPRIMTSADAGPQIVRLPSVMGNTGLTVDNPQGEEVMATKSLVRHLVDMAFLNPWPVSKSSKIGVSTALTCTMVGPAVASYRGFETTVPFVKIGINTPQGVSIDDVEGTLAGTYYHSQDLVNHASLATYSQVWAFKNSAIDKTEHLYLIPAIQVKGNWFAQPLRLRTASSVQHGSVDIYGSGAPASIVYKTTESMTFTVASGGCLTGVTAILDVPQPHEADDRLFFENLLKRVA
mgnify:CR=1 FL=1